MSTIRTNNIVDAAGTGSPAFPNGVRVATIVGSTGANDAQINGITPALSSQAQAEAGTNNTTLMTPLRVADAITALVPAGFGQGQSWQSVSRAASTSYQNTTGKPIMVLFWLATNTSGTIRNATVEASVNNSTWVTVGGVSGSGADAPQCVSIVIPPNHYYRWVWVSSPANASVAAAELR